MDPLGRFVASGSADQQYRTGSVKLWALPSGRLLRTLWESTPELVKDLAIDARGRFLVAGSWDQGPHRGTLKVWELPSGQLLHTFTPGPVDCVAIDGSGRFLAAGYQASERSQIWELGLWELPSGKHLQTLVVSGNACELAFDASGRYLATGGPGTSVQLWAGADLRASGREGR